MPNPVSTFIWGENDRTIPYEHTDQEAHRIVCLIFGGGSSMNTLMRKLLEKLEQVAEVHEELCDTDVREKMANAVWDGFLKPVEGFVVPDNFVMYSSEGDRQVKEVLDWFIPLANERAQALGLDTFHQRLNAFQDLDVQTENQSTYDEFFGWANPDKLDEYGNFKRE